MFLLLILECLTFLWVFPSWGMRENKWQEAYDNYQQGEKATSFEERKKAFNRALYLYNLIEQEVNVSIPLLDLALGDSYFQLNEYGWATLYYERALKKDSSNSVVISHLEKVQRKLGLHSPSSFPLTFLQRSCSLFSQELKVFFAGFMLTFFICSTAIWLTYSWIRPVAVVCSFFLFLIVSHLLLCYYITPLEGVLVNSTGFYREPGWNQPQLTHNPLLAGSKVRILQMTRDKDWLKIESSTGLIGYIPTQSLRLI